MGTSYNANIVTDGLVLCLDAANPRSYPGSGNTWYDLSGNGNNATLTNGPAFSSNNGGNLVFDGVNDYVTIPSIVLHSNNETTYVLFSKQDANTNSSIAVSNYGSSKGFFLNNGGRADGRPGGNPYIFTDTNETLLPNIWYHGVVTVKNNTMTSFRNGLQLPTTASFSGNLLMNNFLEIAKYNTLYFKGSISMVQIYNRGLSPTEIRQNYNATRGRYGY